MDKTFFNILSRIQKISISFQNVFILNVSGTLFSTLYILCIQGLVVTESIGYCILPLKNWGPVSEE